MAREIGNASFIAGALLRLGRVEMESGNRPQARTVLAEAAEVGRGGPVGLSAILDPAALAYEQRNFAAARGWIIKAARDILEYEVGAYAATVLEAFAAIDARDDPVRAVRLPRQRRTPMSGRSSSTGGHVPGAPTSRRWEAAFSPTLLRRRASQAGA